MTRDTVFTLTHFRLNKLPHTIYLEESSFNFRHVRLCDLDIPGEKWLNNFQTVETLNFLVLEKKIFKCF